MTSPTTKSARKSMVKDTWASHFCDDSHIYVLSQRRAPFLNQALPLIEHEEGLFDFFKGEPELGIAFVNQKKQISVLHNVSFEKFSFLHPTHPNCVYTHGIGGSSLGSNMLDVRFMNDDEYFNPVTVSTTTKASTVLFDKELSEFWVANAKSPIRIPVGKVDSKVLKNFVIIPPFFVGMLLKEREGSYNCSVTPDTFLQALSTTAAALFDYDEDPSDVVIMKNFKNFAIPLAMFAEAVRNNELLTVKTAPSDSEEADNNRINAITKAGLSVDNGTPAKIDSTATPPQSVSDDSTRQYLNAFIQQAAEAQKRSDAAAAEYQKKSEAAATEYQKNAAENQKNNAAVNQIYLETTKLNNANNTSKSLFESLPGHARLVFQRATALNHKDEDEPTAPFETCTEIFAYTNRSKASSSFQSTLRESRQRGEFQRGHITSLLQYGLVWIDPITPEGMTFFAFMPCGTKSALEDRRRELNAALKADHDNHLGNDDIMHLTAKALFIPENIHHIEMQVSCYKATLGKMLGPKAWVLNVCSMISEHIDAHYMIYTEQFKHDALFGAKFLFQLDNAFQDFFRSLMASDVHLSEISTYGFRNEVTATLSEVKRFKISATVLPASIVSTTKAGKAAASPIEKHAGGGAGGPVQKKQKGDPPIVAVVTGTVNDNINSAWKIPAGKDYASVYNNLNSIPTGTKGGKQVAFCINFHTVGKCKKGTACNLLHDDPRDVKPSKEAAYTAFLTKCFT